MKDIRFCGHSLEALRGFPAVARREAGYQLDRVQHGLEPHRLETDAIYRTGRPGDSNHA